MAEAFYKRVWNAFRNKPEQPHGRNTDISKTTVYPFSQGYSLTTFYAKMAVDVASASFRHIRVDGNERYASPIKSGLGDCLSVSANIDQIPRAFIQDLALTLFLRGAAVIVPVDTSSNPETGAYDVSSLRVGEVVGWYPRHVRVRVYNDHIDSGEREELLVSKETAAVIINPFYTVMNAPNSTLARLSRKLTLLDMSDEKTATGKLDLIVQLGYPVKGELRAEQAARRRKEIEEQLTGAAHGIAWVDGTETITQLNRPVENTLVAQIESLTKQLYDQLGLTDGILNNSAGEQELLNYDRRTIEPVVSAIADGMNRTFLTKTARTQGQRIAFFRDPFRFLPISQFSEVADSLSRNAVLTPNDIRAILGYTPSATPEAETLGNKNINPMGGTSEIPPDTGEEEDLEEDSDESTEELLQGVFAELEAAIDALGE